MAEVKLHTVLVAVVSSDGFIAQSDLNDAPLHNERDKVHLRQVMSSCDLQILGRTTFVRHREALERSRRTILVATRGADKDVRRISESHEHYEWNPEQRSLGDIAAHFGARRVCLLGGSQIYGYFLDNDLIDEMQITRAPVALGEGIPLFPAQGAGVWDHRTATPSGFALESRCHLDGPEWELFYFSRKK